MTICIQSATNPRVKHWASLLEKKHREREGKFLIEGEHLVQEALKSGAAIETIAYAEARGLPKSIADIIGDKIEQVAVSDAVLTRCSDTVTPQGVFAVVHKQMTSPLEILNHHRALVMVVDGVQDPGNLGTIIRSADAVGASAVLLGKGTVDLYNAKTIRSTMGSIFHLPIGECDLKELLPLAKDRSVHIVATRLEESLSCYEVDFTRDTWFIVGNEGAGVSETALHNANSFVKIPMPGRAESLNVAMAATILLFEAMRQRIS